jgi:transposase
MKRQAYGYRDEKFFELKTLSLHDKNYAFVGWAMFFMLIS